MKKITVALLFAPILALAASAAHAESPVAVGVGVGTTGVDVAMTYKIAQKVNVRGVVSGFEYSKDGSYGSDVDYTGKIKLFNAAALLDYHPFSGSFRVSTGLVYNGNKLSLDGKPKAGGSYEFNGTTYSSSDVGNVSASAKWNKPGVYLGVGFGDPVAKKGFTVSGDLGVTYTGKASTSLTAQCGASIAGTATCDQLQADAAAEEAKLRRDTDKIDFWPVARIMVNYAF